MAWLKIDMPKVPQPIRQFFRRRKPPVVLWRLVGLLVIKTINVWMSTLSYRAARYDPSLDPAEASFSGPAIYVFWHETILLPIYMRPNCRLSMLLSQHQDAEVVWHVTHFACLQVVRGSSKAYGTAAKLTPEVAHALSLAILDGVLTQKNGHAIRLKHIFVDLTSAAATLPTG